MSDEYPPREEIPSAAPKGQSMRWDDERGRYVSDPETDEVESTEADTEPQVLLGVMGDEQDVAR